MSPGRDATCKGSLTFEIDTFFSTHPFMAFSVDKLCSICFRIFSESAPVRLVLSSPPFWREQMAQRKTAAQGNTGGKPLSKDLIPDAVAPEVVLSAIALR